MALFENLFQNNQRNSETINIVKKSTLSTLKKELSFSLNEKVNKGMHGEENILAELRKSKIPMWILHDVYLLDDISKNNAQFDFIIVTPYSICIIESKYVESDILITNSGYKINGKFINGNPAWDQAIHQKAVLTNILQKSAMQDSTFTILPNFIQTFVVYSNTDGTITNNCENEIMQENILHIDSLVSSIEKLALSQKNTSFDDKTCSKIAYTILQKHNEDKLKEYYHSRLIDKKNEKKPKVNMNNISNQFLVPCSNPACTGHFVLRKKRDDNSYFAGCSNFRENYCKRKLSVSEYALRLLQQSGIKMYSWSQECYSCHKMTTVYTYLLHYDLAIYDKMFKEYISDKTIGMGRIYSDKAGDTRYNLPQLDEYLKVLSDSRKLKIDWTEGKRAGGKYLANHCQHCGKFQGRAHIVDNPPEDIQTKIQNGTLIGEDWNITYNHAGITLELLEKILC